MAALPDRRRVRSLGLVSHGLPPGGTGHQIILEELLEGVPFDEIILVGIGGGRWGKRARLPLPIPRLPGKPWESTAAALALAASRALAAPFLPQVRRVLVTLDPTIGVASRWARASGAELWVYAIDLHCSQFWGAGARFRPLLERWRSEAFGQASRGFALSHRMAAWMRTHGFRAPVELLPPLTDVGEAAPLPGGAPSLLYCGWVYRANARPLKWIERAVVEDHPGTSLRLLTHCSVSELVALGLDTTRWSIASVAPNEVRAEVMKCAWGIVALDPEFAPRDHLQVAWPTKLRDYLAIGRPVICVAAQDYAVAEIAAGSRWALLAHDEASTRTAVSSAIAEAREAMAERSAAAHAFAREALDNGTLGRRWRAEVLAP